MTRIGALEAKEAEAISGPSACLSPSVAPAADSGSAGRSLPAKVVKLLVVAPKRRIWRPEPSAREGVWVNTAQPPDDPETSWPSTIFNPFASESEEMVVPTGPPPEDDTQVPDASCGSYSCRHSLAYADGDRPLQGRRRSGRHAAPSTGIGSRLARTFAALR